MSTQLFEEEASRANAPRNGLRERAPRLEEPVVETGESPSVEPAVALEAPVFAPARRTLGDDHASVTHRFRAGSVEGLFIVGLLDDGAPGEVLFVPRQASPAISERLDALTEILNVALPYGVPPGPLAQKLVALTGESEAAPAAQHLAAYLTEKFPEK